MAFCNLSVLAAEADLPVRIPIDALPGQRKHKENTAVALPCGGLQRSPRRKTQNPG